MEDEIIIYWLLINPLKCGKVQTFGNGNNGENCIHEDIKNRLNSETVGITVFKIFFLPISSLKI
jgi:hypothetical protein